MDRGYHRSFEGQRASPRCSPPSYGQHPAEPLYSNTRPDFSSAYRSSQSLESTTTSSQPRFMAYDVHGSSSYSQVPSYSGRMVQIQPIGAPPLPSLSPQESSLPTSSSYGAVSPGLQQTSHPFPTVWQHQPSTHQAAYSREGDSPPSQDPMEFVLEPSRRRSSDAARIGDVRYHTKRKPSNRDEFDGPHQLLDPPSPRTLAEQDRELPKLPTNLDIREQDNILAQVNDILSKSAFDFVAKYQFPIPIEPDKRQVRMPADREWTEWVHLLKRLATKRRIPARVLYNNHIKQLVTILENSLEMRHAAKHQSRPLKDDRNVLQLISAGTQVVKILKDATAMRRLDGLYARTEAHIQERRERSRRGFMV